jgi:hypothetical protein
MKKNYRKGISKIDDTEFTADMDVPPMCDEISRKSISAESAMDTSITTPAEKEKKQSE